MRTLLVEVLDELVELALLFQKLLADVRAASLFKVRSFAH
jgi:hypothetical protein